MRRKEAKSRGRGQRNERGGAGKQKDEKGGGRRKTTYERELG